MKAILRLMAFVIMLIAMTPHAFSQNLESYIASKGVYSLCKAVHPSNDYESGKYNIIDNLVTIEIESRDNVLGLPVKTEVTLETTKKGNLFIKNIYVFKDTDPFAKPFEAFGLQAQIFISLYKALGKEVYEQMRAAVRDATGTDFEYWDGKTWALLAMNLDYYEYLLTGK